MSQQVVLAFVAVLAALVLVGPEGFSAAARLGPPPEADAQVASPSSPPWLDPAWQRRKEVVVSNGSTTALSGHQVRIDLTSQNFPFAEARSDGADLRLTDASGTTLVPLAIERFDAAGQKASLWTKLNLAAGTSAKLYLYYSNPGASSVSDPVAVFDFWEQFRPGLATSSYVRFDQRETGPVLSAGPAGAWDQVVREKVVVLQDDAGWKLYYTGTTSDNNQVTSNIGLATSSDGKTWTRYPGNPVADSGTQDQDMAVLVGPDGRSYMYVERDDYYIDRWTSNDGVSWTLSNPAVKTTAASPVVFYESGTWYLLYEYMTTPTCLTATPCRIHLATSPDGVTWTDSPANPVLAESDDTVTDSVVKDGSTYHLYYHRFEAGAWHAWHATSTDLTTWTNRQRILPGYSSQYVMKDRSGQVRTYAWYFFGDHNYYLLYGKDALRNIWTGQPNDTGLLRLTSEGLEVMGYEITTATYQLGNGIFEARVRPDIKEASMFARAGNNGGFKFDQGYGFSSGDFGSGNLFWNTALTYLGQPFASNNTASPMGQWLIQRMTLNGSSLQAERIVESSGAVQASVSGTHSSLTQGRVGLRAWRDRQATVDWARTRKVVPVEVTVTVRDETGNDTTPPTVSTVAPADGATAVAITTAVTATFSEAMDPASIGASTFTLVKQGATAPVAATVSYDAATLTATLRPSASLDTQSVYTATVKAGTAGVKDLAGNPLAADKVWSFTTTGSAPPPGTGTYLSDLTWTSATNGWGPVEKDMSNGEAGAGDGRTITLNGKTYAKGLGAHAPSDVRYALGGSCTDFTAEVGIDDEIATNGSVVFQVFADGTKLYDSGVMSSSTATKSVAVSLAGKLELQLVIADGGDNNWFDHADWASAQVFCGGGDTVPPTVAAVTPTDGATGVATTSAVTATFSEAMDPATITTATMTLVRQGTTTPVSATVTYDSPTRTATLRPTSALQGGSTYTATVKSGTGGVKDAAGNPLAADKVWSFTTAAAPQPPPNGTSYLSDLTWTAMSNGWGPVEKDKSNGESGAGDGHTLTLNGVTYAKGLGAHAASEVRYYLGGSCTLLGAEVGIDDEIATNGSVVFQVFADGTKLYDSGVMSSSTATKSVAVSLAGKLELQLVVTDAGDNNWFDHADWANARITCGSSGDTTPPTVTTVAPADGATGVAVTASATATFSEAMDSASLTTSSFSVVPQGGTTPVAATVTYDSATKTATLQPTASLLPSTTYTVTVKGGASGAKDLAGNPLAADKVWAFTTAAAADTTPPTVTGVTPTDGATGVAVTTAVTATFSEAMDPATLTTSTVTLVRQGTTTPLAASVSYDAASKTVTLQPSASLQASTAYTATVKGGASGAKDLAGNPLAADKVWAFTTAAAADTTPPTVTGTTPAIGATDMGTNVDVKAVFSEAMNAATITTTTFTLVKQGTTTPIAATVTYDAASKTATLRPSSKLQGNTVYTATVKSGTNGVKDQAGNPLAVDKVWSFTTKKGPPSGTSYLSDLEWVSATNGWGPVERDRANGEQGANDGTAIILNGVVYPKGLGVHAASDVRYDLAGTCTSFTSDVGLDDSRTQGTVVFQVWLDGTKVYDSGTMTGSTPTKTATLDVSSKQELRLVVTDAGDGQFYNHADWAGARITCV